MGLNTSGSTAPSSLQALTPDAGISLLDEELASLGKRKGKGENSWRVNTNLEDQALNKQKRKNRSPQCLHSPGSLQATAQKKCALSEREAPDDRRHRRAEKPKSNVWFLFS